MAIADKVKDAIALLEEALKSEAAPAPTDPSLPSEPAPSVDPEALKVLQDKIDALAKENADLRAAIKAEIEDEKADTARLEAALAPIAEPAPVPVVDVETVASASKAEEKVSSPDEPAKPVSAGIQ